MLQQLTDSHCEKVGVNLLSVLPWFPLYDSPCTPYSRLWTPENNQFSHFFLLLHNSAWFHNWHNELEKLIQSLSSQLGSFHKPPSKKASHDEIVNSQSIMANLAIFSMLGLIFKLLQQECWPARQQIDRTEYIIPKTKFTITSTNYIINLTNPSSKKASQEDAYFHKLPLRVNRLDLLK